MSADDMSVSGMPPAGGEPRHHRPGAEQTTDEQDGGGRRTGYEERTASRRPAGSNGSAHSSTRDQLLDAAEQLLLEEGYAAVTSRRVGARAGITPQLVHYYFRTMDDLFIEVFRRRADAGLELLREALRSRPTLHQLWDLRETGLTTPRFSLEYMALANHRKAVRATLTDYYRRYRQLQLDVFTAAFADLGIPPERCPPLIAQLFMIGITQIMAIDLDLGVDTDREAVDEFVRRQIDRLAEERSEPAAATGG